MLHKQCHHFYITVLLTLCVLFATWLAIYVYHSYMAMIQSQVDITYANVQRVAHTIDINNETNHVAVTFTEKEICPVELKFQTQINRQANTIAVKYNNPLNIKKLSKAKWKGQIGYTKSGYVKFSTVEHGFRAAGRVLSKYATVHNLTTVKQILNRFAVHDGSVRGIAIHNKYISYVSSQLRLKSNERFDVIEKLPDLLQAMARFESGVDYPDRYLSKVDVVAQVASL